MTDSLPTNTKPAEHDCNWCGAKAKADVHSAACPLGERYREVQRRGGVKQ